MTIELPPLPRRGQPEWYDDRTDWDNTVADLLKSVQASAPVSVRDFGAVGDGVADDSDAFDLAIGAIAAQGGGELIIPPGTYWCRRRIELCDDLTITGYGATLVRRAGTGEEGYTVFRSRYGHGQGYGKGLKNFQATGLTFRGSFLPGEERSVNGFSIFHGENIVLRDLTFIEAQMTGHCIDLCGCKNVIIDNVKIMGMKPGEGNYQRAEAIQVDIAAVGSSSAPEAAGDQDNLPCVDVAISNVHSEAITVGGVRFPASVLVGSHALTGTDDHKNIMIRNVTVIEPPVWTDHQIQGLIHFARVDGLHVENVSVNFAGNPSRNIIGLYACSTGNVDNVSIRNVHAWNYSPTGSHSLIATESVSQANTGPMGSISVSNLRADAPSNPTTGINAITLRVGSLTVTDSTIRGRSRAIWAAPNTNTGTSPGEVAFSQCQVYEGGDAALYVDGAVSLLVQNCTVKVPGYNAIRVADTTRVSVNGCDLGGAVGHSQVVHVLGDVEAFAVSNNIVSAPSGQRGLRIEPDLSAKGTIVGNTILGGTGHQIVVSEGNAWTVANNAI